MSRKLVRGHSDLIVRRGFAIGVDKGWHLLIVPYMNSRQIGFVAPLLFLNFPRESMAFIFLALVTTDSL